MKIYRESMLSTVRLFLLLLLVSLARTQSFAQGPVFTYQGRLTDGGPAANSNYDFRFRLFDSAAAGTQLGPLNALANVAVTNGVFTVQLNFGNPLSFPDNFSGADRYLEIAVRQGSQDLNAPFTTLSPRQQITASPYALRSASAGSADTAANATTLGGVAADQFVTTNDSRLSDPRPPAAGSSNYVQNGTAVQAGGSFNISGNGAAGGTLSGNVVNSATTFNINGSRVLSVAGPSVTFVGIGVGPLNSGFSNSFFGSTAGFANTNGSNNSFFGNNAGTANTGDPSDQSVASANSFFGSNAGLHNTRGGANTFVGNSAGNQNVLGSGNTFVGDGAGFNNFGSNNTYLGSGVTGTPGLSNATAIGSGATVTTSNTMVLGTNSVTVQVPGNITSSTQYQIGGQTVLSVPGAGNTFVGRSAGTVNTGFGNSFFGLSAGSANTNGSDNSFFGADAGKANTGDPNQQSLGSANSFFGANAGVHNTTAGSNTFLGNAAGFQTLTGGDNTFVGAGAGFGNTDGANNTAIGNGAGQNLGPGNVDNIYIANEGANESDTIRIGNLQSKTFIAGINGAAVNGPAVLINANGQLGTVLSSRRFKQNIRDMGENSGGLLRLRPVTFQYKPEYATDPAGLQYGLIAEEVARVYPNLVVYGNDGKPYSVLYHLLPPMLLNEVQKQARQLRLQELQLKTQGRQLVSQAQQQKAQDQQLVALSARLVQLEKQQNRRHRNQYRHPKTHRS